MFDSGLHERLTLTMADAFSEPMNWGKPRASIVRDYALDLFDATGALLVSRTITDNFQRRRVQGLETHRVQQLRITVNATHGIPEARICEIRCYGS